MAISDFLEAKIINHVLRNTAYTTPGTSIWVALYSSSPGDDNSGTEISGNAYVRVQVSSWDAPSATGGDTENTSAVTFAAASGGDWGTVSHIGILDASTSGNLLFHGALASTVVIENGDIGEFSAGALDLVVA